MYLIGMRPKSIKVFKLFIVDYFFLDDALNTTYIVVSTLQNEIQKYDIIQICFLSILSFAA